MRSFAAPSTQPDDIAFDGSNFWLIDNNVNRMYLLNTDAVELWFYPVKFADMRALAIDGFSLWSVAAHTGRIMQNSKFHGQEVRLSGGLGADLTGIEWDGSHLWVSDDSNNLILLVDPDSFTVLRDIPAPGNSPRGLAWDGSSLWVVNPNTQSIYQISPETGAVIRSFVTPGQDPSGLTWDGRTLWHTDIATDRIYQIGVA